MKICVYIDYIEHSRDIEIFFIIILVIVTDFFLYKLVANKLKLFILNHADIYILLSLSWQNSIRKCYVKVYVNTV